MSSQWSPELTHRLGREIRRLRGKERSAQWLADRTTELGYPVPRTTISETETGRRKGPIPLQEILVIAAALHVPPVQLLFPGLPHGDIEVLPGRHVFAEDALSWFVGATYRQPDVAVDPDCDTSFIASFRALESFRMHKSVAEERLAAANTPEARQRAYDDIASFATLIAEESAAITAAGGVVRADVYDARTDDE